MTVIRGSIDKVKEVLKKGYEEPIVQTTRGYSLNTGALGAGIHTYALPAIALGTLGYVKRFSISTNDGTAVHTVQLRRTTIDGNVWDFHVSYFYRNYEWELGDIPIYPVGTWSVIITNNAAGAIFAVNVYWIES